MNTKIEEFHDLLSDAHKSLHNLIVASRDLYKPGTRVKIIGCDVTGIVRKSIMLVDVDEDDEFPTIRLNLVIRVDGGLSRIVSDYTVEIIGDE